MRLAPAPGGGPLRPPPGAAGAPVTGLTRWPPPGVAAGELDGTVPVGDGPIEPCAGWPKAVPGGEAGLTAGAEAGTLPVLAACGSVVASAGEPGDGDDGCCCWSVPSGASGVAADGACRPAAGGTRITDTTARASDRLSRSTRRGADMSGV